MTATPIHYRQWGEGPPVIALHGLGLESSSFTGIGEAVAERGMRMMAADLPGFGLTPQPDGPLTIPALAAPVIELAATLDKPLVMGMSLGARVALEAVLEAPELFRGAVLMATPLPRRRFGWLFRAGKILSPGIAQRIPLQIAWPMLKKQADKLEDEHLNGEVRHDWFMRASKRTVYYISCPATRYAFVSAARELAMDPAYGPEGVWTRLEDLSVPVAFVWGDLDKLIDTSAAPAIEELVPDAFHLHVPCGGHFKNGPHYRCMNEAVLEGIDVIEAVAEGKRGLATPRTRRREISCVVAAHHDADAAADETPAAATEPGDRAV